MTAREVKESAFLKCILDGGGVSFLEYHDRYFVRTPEGVEELVTEQEEVIKDGKTLYRERPLFKSTLQRALKDCNAIHSSVQSAALSRKGLTAVFENYYSCKGIKWTSYGTDFQPIVKTWSFCAGAIYSALTLDPEKLFSFPFYAQKRSAMSLSFSPSICLELSQPGKNQIAVFRTGITYFQTNHVITVRPNFSDTEKIEQRTEMSRLEVPLSVRFNLGHGKVMPYLAGGLGLNLVLSAHDRFVFHRTYSGISEQKEVLPFSRVFFNPLVAAGVSIPVAEHAVIIEGSLSNSVFVLSPGTNHPSAYITAFGLRAGFSF